MPGEAKLEHGIPIFLSQLADALTPAPLDKALHLVGAPDTGRDMADSAELHGRELLKNGFTVAQVVHGYGDVCQVVTELASEGKAAISTDDFQVFNRCLDSAIAGAVTAYGRQRELDIVYQGTERLGVLAHELRNLLNTAILSFDIIKKGMVGTGGSTGAMHSRSLSGLSALVERSLAEVRLASEKPLLERISVLAIIEEIEVVATMQAEGHGLHLTVGPVDADIAIDADRQLLLSALANLVQNAFKFSRASGTVTIDTHASGERVLIDVCDECGGLPPGKAEELFRPFTQRSSNRSGLGLGLSIALNAVRANQGNLYVRDIPGKGCVFTIDLPRQPPSPKAVVHVLPDRARHEDPGNGSVRRAPSREPKAGAI